MGAKNGHSGSVHGRPRAAQVFSLGPSRCQAAAYPVPNQLPLEFRNAGEDAEDQPTLSFTVGPARAPGSDRQGRRPDQPGRRGEEGAGHPTDTRGAEPDREVCAAGLARTGRGKREAIPRQHPLGVVLVEWPPQQRQVRALLSLVPDLVPDDDRQADHPRLLRHGLRGDLGPQGAQHDHRQLERPGDDDRRGLVGRRPLVYEG